MAAASWDASSKHLCVTVTGSGKEEEDKVMSHWERMGFVPGGCSGKTTVLPCPALPCPGAGAGTLEGLGESGGCQSCRTGEVQGTGHMEQKPDDGNS